MAIERVVIRNYRTLRSADVKFSDTLNIVVGDNESGKSTLLEAINLALRCQLNRRPAAYELHPYLFNEAVVAEYVKSHNNGTPQPPPEIRIEVFLADTPEVAELKGSINSEMVDTPGISLSVELDEEHCAEQYAAYIANGKSVNSVPIEYYQVVWRGFNGDTLTSRSIPLKSALIDPSAISNTYAANKYVLEIVRDYLTKTQAVDLALSYRHMRDKFLNDERIKAINEDLAGKKGEVSDKILSMAMDTTTRASWETGVLPHLDDIPLTLVGKGEQNAIKIKLAVASEDECSLFLMEEPENHLSHANLNKLISHLASKCKGKQLIITTHSSFVLNKLGVDSVLMFNGDTGITLDDLPPTTKTYFKRLPGHDTLRMILAGRSILVEGPSDELIVQKAFRQTHGCMPLGAGVEVISVSLAFKRFLDVAQKLNLAVTVVRDNDGDAAAKKALFADYESAAGIKICIDGDNTLRSLEPQLLAANGRDKLNRMLGTACATDDELLSYMTGNKADSALALFESKEKLTIPGYIQDAVA
ncbi:MAG: AAA family ATPase [Pseudomonadota bacterium]|nr:AAA family ATPase [Pseudomonadota bacterium]